MPASGAKRKRAGARRQHRSAHVLSKKRLVSSRRHASRAKISYKSLPVPTADVDELMVTGIMKHAVPVADTTVQNIIYNSGDAARRLGYKFGFHVGQSVHAQSANGMAQFFDALENLGMGKALYYPSGSYATITSGKSARKYSSGSKLHVFESGIIAGYLSGRTGRMINVTETACSSEGHDRCQFVAEPSEVQQSNPAGRINNPSKEIARAIMLSNPVQRDGENTHLALSNIPFMQEPLTSSVSRIFSDAGRNIAHTCHGDYNAALKHISDCFDLAGIEVKNRARGKKVIRLKYKQYNSMEGLANLSGSMVLGFAKSFFRSNPQVRTGLSKDNTYFVDIRLK